jgi:hypothetical protein
MIKHRLLPHLVIGSLWLGTAGAGMALLWRYAAAAGEAAAAPAQWPPESRVARSQHLATLLLAVHPHCPCSRATMGELAKLMAQARGLVEARVVFVRPEGVPVGWEKTGLWESAAAIPGVTVMSDEGGAEAKRFGARTSGQALLYDRQGLRVFSGGITAARGHLGDNAGRSSVVALLRGGGTQAARTPVFGCPLFAAGDGCAIDEECQAGKD